MGEMWHQHSAHSMVAFLSHPFRNCSIRLQNCSVCPPSVCCCWSEFVVLLFVVKTSSSICRTAVLMLVPSVITVVCSAGCRLQQPPPRGGPHIVQAVEFVLGIFPLTDNQ